MSLIITLAVVVSAAWGVGLLARKVGVPAVLGMIVGGAVAAQLLAALPLPAPQGPVQLGDVAPRIREAVLAVILLRAGLSLSRGQLTSAGTLALRLGSLPLLGDAALITLGGVWLLHLSWPAALVLGLTLAAISPAIVIPGVLAILGKRSGADRRVPTALLAGAPLDNILCIAGLGVALDLARGVADDAATLAWRLPLGLAAAVVAGWVAGRIAAWAVARLARPGVQVALLWILAGGLIALGQLLSLPYVLSVITLGATVRARATATQTDIAPLERGLSRLWDVVQYALFGLIGAAIDLRPLAEAGLLLGVVIGLGQLGRAAMSWLATTAAGMSTRERTAAVLAYVPKATIQAAFGSAALDQGMPEGPLILTGAVLAVVCCAPLGSVTLHRLADRLLPGGTEPAEGQPTA
ncbi:MAG: cation:proton antiporter [Deltaproteobacteria bacterium]|nr:cation:proton antiporter [Deltaproteobacteria bacterium]